MRQAARLSSFLSVAMAAVLATACVTINVYFPEAAVKDLSQQIEAAVAAEARQAAETASDEGATAEDSGGMASMQPNASHSMGLVDAANIAVGHVLHWISAPQAFAAEPVAAPEITNPAIRKIIASRGQRVAELRALKNQGVVGENQKALVEIRDLAALGLKERAAAQKLIKAENDDRERMFKEIAAATGADLSTLPQIQSTYADTLRQNAKAGDWIQGTDGNWNQKG